MSDRLIFICYNHQDKEWKDLVESQLGLLEQQGKCEVWSDTDIGVGEDWYKRIEDTLQKALVAILLISEYSLTSNFIMKEEVPRLLKRRQQEGLKILPILVKDCAFEVIDWLSPMRIVPRDRRALEQMRKPTARTEIRKLVQEIAQIFKAANPVSSESRRELPPRARPEIFPKPPAVEAQRSVQKLIEEREKIDRQINELTGRSSPSSSTVTGYQEDLAKHFGGASQQTTSDFKAQTPEREVNAKKDE